MKLPQIISLILIIILVPLSIAAEVFNWGTFAVFFTSAIAIIPLSLWLSRATEKIGRATNPTLGGLLNAVFSNAVVLIISITALKEGLIDLVKSSLTGSILGDLLLFMGLGMLTGGIRYKEQEFKPILARVNGTSMALAVTAVALPTMVISTSNIVDPTAIENLSLVVAIILIAVYGLSLLFSLKTHRYLYDIEESDPSQNSDLKVWILILIASTLAVAFESDLFVGVVESAIEGLGLTPLFTGVILLPLISDVTGIVTVTRLASKNEMDLMVSVAMGDGLLIALFVSPLLVLAGLILNQPMDLDFNPFEVVALVVAIALTNLVSYSGNSNWFNGALLLATYIILGVAFYYHPA